MNQPIRPLNKTRDRQAQGKQGFSQVILLGIIAVIVLTGVGGFLVLREKRAPTSQESAQQKVSPPETEAPTRSLETQAVGNSVTSPIEPIPSPVQPIQPPKSQPQPEPKPKSAPPASPQKTIIEEDKPPVLKNLGVNFEPWDKNTNRAGAFIFLPSEKKVFLEYGVEVESSEGGTKILPTFEYRIAADADVFAAIDGVITKIVYQPQTQDYEILIQPKIHSQWTVGHDHVSNIKVFEGDSVRAGDILGKAGTLGGAFGRTEIMIWGPSSANRPLTYCPFKLFAPELLLEYQQKVSQHMKDWEEFKGNANLYNEEKHLYPGCVYETLLD
ncbi:MAG: peptidoglycan DD-metalloendopeptidase family protein [Nanoarchaeota archaeon]|nr:peptidoglycan DD-metalloendopeptidase family protein [Nanoarchaeota archaeon]